jgi:hypothetical protein
VSGGTVTVNRHPLERATLAVSAKQRGEMGRQYGVGTVRAKVIRVLP